MIIYYPKKPAGKAAIKFLSTAVDIAVVTTTHKSIGKFMAELNSDRCFGNHEVLDGSISGDRIQHHVFAPE